MAILTFKVPRITTEMINKKVIIYLVLLLIGFLGGYYLKSTNHNTKVVHPQALWNIKLADKYEDEPSVENQFLKVSSSSAWLVPANPVVIEEDPVLKFRVDRLFDAQETRSEVWDNWPHVEEELNKKKLDKKYHDFFIKEGKLPWGQEEIDLNGDGIKDKIFESHGVGCASCHVNLIDIFIGEKAYITFSNEGGAYPRKDNRGLYITNAFMGEDYATCCPDKFVISKFEWNGDGFTEIARKTVWVIKQNN